MSRIILIDFANNRDDDLWRRIRPDVKQITFFQPRNPPPASPLRGSRRCFGTSSNLLSEPLSTWRCLRTFAHLQQGLVATLWGKPGENMTPAKECIIAIWDYLPHLFFVWRWWPSWDFLLQISITVKKDELGSPKKQTRSDLGKYQNDKILFAAPFLNLSMLTRANLDKHLYILFIVPTSLGKGSYQGESLGNRNTK